VSDEDYENEKIRYSAACSRVQSLVKAKHIEQSPVSRGVSLYTITERGRAFLEVCKSADVGADPLSLELEIDASKTSALIMKEKIQMLKLLSAGPRTSTQLTPVVKVESYASEQKRDRNSIARVSQIQKSGWAERSEFRRGKKFYYKITTTGKKILAKFEEEFLGKDFVLTTPDDLTIKNVLTHLCEDADDDNPLGRQLFSYMSGDEVVEAAMKNRVPRSVFELAR
jgi:DNA-binding PadR family transcriptional regulator